MGCLSSKQFAEHPLLAEASSPTHSINRDVIPESKLEQMVKSIPSHKVQSMKNQSTLWRISGPDGKQDEASFKDIAIGKTISTYPTYSTGLRFGDPIADVFSAIGFEHAVCAVVCDGCGWGERSKRAANIACQSFTQYVEERISKVDNITAGVILILKALEFAHISIMKGVDPYESGSTTLTGGLLLKQEDRGWGFVCCNIGDAKAFHWSATTHKITDITHGNRRNLSDATDPGGRIGSSGGDPDPDLRNLGVYYFPCQQKDIIFLLSDGAHDNLDPQQLGVTPAEMKIQAKDWHDAERDFPKQTEAAKTGYTNELLHNKLDTENTQLTPKFIIDSIIHHCFQVTKNTREFMQSNPQARQPDDHFKFPGKLDHTTVVAFTVGSS